jgi:predicted nucleic acid-binding protein
MTELGFLRVLTNVAPYGIALAGAQAILERLKSAENVQMTFFSDDLDAAHLPGWVRGPKQITDGHLLELARAHGAGLATLDARIPGAFTIPTNQRDRENPETLKP